MRLKSYMNEERLDENIFKKIAQGVRKMSKRAIEKMAKQSWIRIVDMAKDSGLEDELKGMMAARFRIRIGSLDQITKARVVESKELNEDWKHWWDVIAGEGFFNIKFYPALQVWFEAANVITAMFKDQPIDPTNLKKIAFFGLLWLALTSGKFIKDFNKWKKENRDEYYAERPKLAAKHGYVFKDPKKDPNEKKVAGFI